MATTKADVDLLKNYNESNIEPLNKRQRSDILEQQNQKIEQIKKEKAELQNKCDGYERINSELLLDHTCI